VLESPARARTGSRSRRGRQCRTDAAGRYGLSRGASEREPPPTTRRAGEAVLPWLSANAKEVNAQLKLAEVLTHDLRQLLAPGSGVSFERSLEPRNGIALNHANGGGPDIRVCLLDRLERPEVSLEALTQARLRDFLLKEARARCLPGSAGPAVLLKSLVALPYTGRPGFLSVRKVAGGTGGAESGPCSPYCCQACENRFSKAPSGIKRWLSCSALLLTALMSASSCFRAWAVAIRLVW